MSKKAESKDDNVFGKLKGNKIVWILVAVMVIQLLVNIMLLRERGYQTELGTTLATTTIPRNMDNEIRFGKLYENDYETHNLIFTGLVGHDDARKDQIYVSAGSIDFDLKTTPNTPHTLNIYVTNLNELCRKDEVYVDGRLAGSMNKKTNEPNPSSTYAITNITSSSEYIHVKILGGGNPNKDPNECDWGHDITAVQIV